MDDERRERKDAGQGFTRRQLLTGALGAVGSLVTLKVLGGLARLGATPTAQITQGEHGEGPTKPLDTPGPTATVTPTPTRHPTINQNQEKYLGDWRPPRGD